MPALINSSTFFCGEGKEGGAPRCLPAYLPPLLPACLPVCVPPGRLSRPVPPPPRAQSVHQRASHSPLSSGWVHKPEERGRERVGARPASISAVLIPWIRFSHFECNNKICYFQPPSSIPLLQLLIPAALNWLDWWLYCIYGPSLQILIRLPVCCDCAARQSARLSHFGEASGKFSEVELAVFLIKTVVALLNGHFMFREGEICAFG